MDDDLYEFFFKINHVMPAEEEKNFDDIDDLDVEEGDHHGNENQYVDQ